jgi:TIR domain
MPRVFLSYTRADLDLVHPLEQALAAQGVSIWRDQHSIYGGEQWPKAIGEAIAATDAIILVWSANSAQSHFIEFEWTTALALKKRIIPCLLDDTPLPPSLRAINGIFCQDVDAAVVKILQSMPMTAAPTAPERRAEVIANLQKIKSLDPEKVVNQVRALFSQSNLNVKGNIIQAGGDVHLTISEPSRHSVWLIFAAVAVLVVGIIIFPYFLRNHQTNTSGVSSLPATPAPMSYLRGLVVDGNDNPIVEAEVRVEELPDRPPVKTTSSGGFYVDKIPGNSGDRIRIYVSKDGHKTHNEYVALPGPIRIRLERSR